MTSVRSREWLNENSYRAFPFVENSDRLCSNGISMPEWLVADARGVVCTFTEDADVVDTEVLLSSFGVTSGLDVELNLVFRTVGGSGDVASSSAKATACVTPGTFSRVVASVPKTDATFRFASVNLTLGAPVHLEELSELRGRTCVLRRPRPFLRTRFVIYPGGFGTDTIRGNDETSPLSGEVLLKSGYNTTMRVRDNRIVLGVSATAGLGYACPDTEEKCDAIYRINGQRADSNGNFSISGGEGIQVSSGKYEGIPAIVVKTTSLVDSYAKAK